MKFFLAVTDNDWFEYLADLQPPPDEVNFWLPGGGGFGAIQQWEPLLFKLHYPQNYVVGGGYFVRYSLLPLQLAWEVFGQKNGLPDFSSFYAKIAGYRSRRGQMEPNPQIGCVVLTEPFFFEEKDWIEAPVDWKPNIVRGKTYDTHTPIGAQLWQQVLDRLAVPLQPAVQEQPVVAEVPLSFQQYQTTRRLGQGGFRVLVTEAYQRRCAMTGAKTLPVLEAAHIKPTAQSGPHRVDNGLLLRSDLHILFDRGYMTVTEDYRIEVSRRIKEEFDNGEEYYSMHGQRLQVLPGQEIERPAREFIQWHNEQVYMENSSAK